MKHITAEEDDIAERSNFEMIRKNEWEEKKRTGRNEAEEHYFVYIKIKCKRMTVVLILSG